MVISGLLHGKFSSCLLFRLEVGLGSEGFLLAIQARRYGNIAFLSGGRQETHLSKTNVSFSFLSFTVNEEVIMERYWIPLCRMNKVGF